MLRLVASARRPAVAALSGCVMLSTLSACSKVAAATGSSAPTVESLTIISGDQQVRQAGRPLRAPLLLRATDAAGRAVPSAPITLVVTQGGGSVDSASVRTNANGEARVRWTLGPDIAQTLIASSQSAAPLRVTATGLVPTDVVVAQGNGQTGRVGLALATPLVVRVLSTGNVPMDSINVSLQIVSGGGSLAPQSLLTNASGEATIRWTVGPTPGANTALIRAGTLDPITVTATAIP
jgi:hypothetical protein